MERILEVIRQELQENPSSSSSSSVSSTKLSSPSVASSSRVTNNLKNITSNNSSITDPTPSAVQLIKVSIPSVVSLLFILPTIGMDIVFGHHLYIGGFTYSTFRKNLGFCSFFFLLVSVISNSLRGII